MTRERLPAPERRRQIIAVAADLFRQHPYGDVSLDDVAEKAGVTRGLINHHFGTKRDLYVAVVEQILVIEAFPVPEYIHGMTLRERLEQSVREWLDGIERNRDLWIDSIRAQGIGDAKIVGLVEEAREKAARRLAAVIGAGPADALAPEELAMLRVFEGLAEAAVVQWLDYGRLSRAQAEQMILEACDMAAERLLARRDPVSANGH